MTATPSRSAGVLAMLGLTFVTGIAIASPTVAPPRPKVSPSVNCAASEQNCLKQGWLETPCGRTQANACKPIIEQKLVEQHQASSAPVIPMMKVKGSDIPKDLKTGKYHAYKQAGSPKQNSIVWASNPFSALSVDRVTKVDPAVAATAHRTPAWDANGETIVDCAEYAYEQIYDVGRFLDAAEACRGDSDCVFSVAYMANTPGIARRTLRRKDGKPMRKQFDLHKGAYPKNELFMIGTSFLYANGLSGGTPIPRIPKLEAALTTGKQYYDLGRCSGSSCNNTRKFENDWTWHQTMQSKTAHLSDAERDEYTARKAKFLELLAQYHAAVVREQDQIHQTTVQRFELPFDSRLVNPFDRFDHMNKVQTVRVNEIKSLQKKFGPNVLNTPATSAIGAPAVQGSLQPRGRQRSGSAVDVLAAPQPTAQPTARPPTATTTLKPKPKPSLGTPGTSSLQTSPCNRSHGWGWETFGKGPISCKIGEFLRNEWARKERGQKSCLDLGNPDCDWTIEMFEQSLLAQVPLLDEYMDHERECRAWTTGTLPPANNLTHAEQIIENNRATIGQAWQELKPYEQPHTSAGRSYGKNWSKKELAGRKNWFAAQFEYDTGWDVSAQKTDANGNVCELSGKLHGKIGFDAWVVGKQVKVVDGQLHASVNDNGSGQARFKRKLYALGQSVVGGDAWVSNTVSEQLSGFMVRLPTPRPSFTFYAGPVPVTGAMWGELQHGTMLTASGSAPTSCNANDTGFRVKGGLGPFFAAYGAGQVGVGISGIVSAGLRARLNLIMLQMPLEIGTRVVLKSVNGQQRAEIAFDSELSLLLSTLAGRVSVYLEFLFYEEEWEIFRWRGLGPARVPLMPKLTTSLPVIGMKKG